MTGVTVSRNMRVPTRWPALVPAIIRAGHEPVLLEPEDLAGVPTYAHATPFEYGRGGREEDMPSTAVTARPRGAHR